MYECVKCPAGYSWVYEVDMCYRPCPPGTSRQCADGRCGCYSCAGAFFVRTRRVQRCFDYLETGPRNLSEYITTVPQNASPASDPGNRTACSNGGRGECGSNSYCSSFCTCLSSQVPATSRCLFELSEQITKRVGQSARQRTCVPCLVLQIRMSCDALRLDVKENFI